MPPKTKPPPLHVSLHRIQEERVNLQKRTQARINALRPLTPESGNEHQTQSCKRQMAKTYTPLKNKHGVNDMKVGHMPCSMDKYTQCDGTNSVNDPAVELGDWHCCVKTYAFVSVYA
jgi:hypothetical protein